MYTSTLFNQENNYPRAMTQGDNWSKRLEEIIQKYATDADFDNEQLAQKLEISQRDLFRKVKKATGYSPNQYIQKYRLKLALQLLCEGRYRTVNETAEAIGYHSVSYFINQFEKEYGKTPLKVLQENGWR